MFRCKKILLSIFAITFFSLAVAQNNSWRTSAEFIKPEDKSYIISSTEPIQSIKTHWNVLGIRSKNQYIVSPKPGINYTTLSFEWKEIDVNTIIEQNYSFNESNPLETYPSIIVFSPFITKNQINNLLSSLHISFNPSDSKFKGINIVLLDLTKDEIYSIAKNKYVTSIEPYYQDVLLNSNATALTNTQIVKSPSSLGGENLSGKGVVIGIGDDGINAHSDINHRLIRQFNPVISSGHAIHVSVTAAGNGIINESATGFASQADVISHFFNAVLVYGQAMYEDYNMTLTNNSYAQMVGECEYAGVYTSISEAVDEMIYNNRKLFHIFASGNDGLKTCSPYPTGFGTVVGFYQASKNALVVGNIGKNLQYLYNGSSKGPVRDGRIKPEIGANGVLVYSGWNNDTYVPNNGTSMACPNVTGAAALITEKYKLLHDGELPDSDLLKALLMNGAQDVYNPGPDFFYGFGVMNLKQSITMLNNAQYIQDSILHGESKTFDITVPANVSKAKFMVYWHDLPATPTPDDNTLPKLINDLDMTLTTPSSGVLQPWILNPYAPTDPAVRGIDRINNVEQISLDFPTSGTYTVNLNGFNVIEGAQDFVLVWDFEMNELALSSPIGFEKFAENDTLRIHFTNPPTSNTFTVQLSTDNGASWTILNSSIESHVRHFNYYIPSGINSDKCKIRVKENGTSHTATSQAFTISQKPVIELDVEAQQCPGSIAVFWNSIPSALSYILYMHIDGEMKGIDTVSASTTKYVFTGLKHDEKYQVSVAPLFATDRGIRANAVSRIPNNGSCIGTDIPEFDLALIDFNNLQNGRLHTSLELANNEIIAVKVQNRGKNTITSIPLSLYMNGSLVASKVFTVSLDPGAVQTLSFSETPVNLNAIGEYNFQVFKTATTYSDNIRINDTIMISIRQIDNPALDLSDGYIENFELTSRGYYSANFIGLWGADRWDYFKTNGWGRLTHFVNSEVSISDSHALTMDLRHNARSTPDSISTNSAIVTLNLSDYNIVEKEIRFDFQYRFAGKPKYFLDNTISLRGKDTDPWIFVSLLDSTMIGEVKYTSDFSINDILSANDQTFSTSTQIKIQQKDTSLVAGMDWGNGLTIDSFRLYVITDDVSLQSINNPKWASCETGSQNIIIEVRNNVFYTMYDIPVFYKINDGTIHTGIIDSIPSKTTIAYTFDTPYLFDEFGMYNIIAWVNYASDESRGNDTLHQNFVITSNINSYPYLQTFESSTESYFFTASNSAWIKNNPSKRIIKHAANGDNAFSTSLISSDTAARISYLYSPCFDISTLNEPTLSFSNALAYNEVDTSNPTKAYVEYSLDGANWQRLGSYGSGANWYDNEDNTWSMKSFNWISSSIELPKEDKIILRFVFESYPDNRTEIWSIDDIHIYDKKYTIHTSNGSKNHSLTHTSGLSEFIITSENTILGTVQASHAMGDIELNAHNHTEPIIIPSNESLILSNFTIRHNSTNPYTLGVYVSHDALEKLWSEENCPSCYKVNSIYETGISTYHSPQTSEINNSLEDNQSGSYQFISRKNVQKIPYYDGYILIFENKEPGEIWFNSGIPGDNDLSVIPIQLQGEQWKHHYAHLFFDSKIDSYTTIYYLERKDITTGEYNTIAEYTPINDSLSHYNHIDQPVIVDNQAIYRVRYILNDGSQFFTSEVLLQWQKNGSFGIYPNPVTDGMLYISWNLDEANDIEYRIVNTAGQTIHKNSIENEVKLGFIVIPMREFNLAPGNYFIQLKSGKEEETIKFVYLQ